MKKPFSFVEALGKVNTSPTETQVEMLRVVDVRSEAVMNLSDEVRDRSTDIYISKKFGGPSPFLVSSLKSSAETLLQAVRELEQMKMILHQIFKEDMEKIDELHIEWARSH